MYQQTTAKLTINTLWFTIKNIFLLFRIYYQLWFWETRMHNHAKTTNTNHQISKNSVQQWFSQAWNDSGRTINNGYEPS